MEAYKNPPITEAIVEIQFDLPKSIKVTDLSKVRSHLSDSYTGFEDLNQNNIVLEINKNSQSQTNTFELIGYKFTDPTNNYVLTIKKNGLGISKLKPYNCWQDFSKEIKIVFKAFNQIIAFNKLTLKRVGIRYINAIHAPLPVEFEQYLKVSPSLPESLPQSLNNFFTQYSAPYGRIKGNLVLTQTLSETKNGKLPIIIDIDLATKTGLPQDKKSLWKLLDVMRDEKNKIFKSCITEKTEELFK